MNPAFKDADECPDCGEKAVIWNPFNKVTQCHNCGTVVE